MRIEVTMPQMGESVVEGTIVKWLKNVGDSVQHDETLLEISTDKVDSEIPSPATGVVAEILFPEGETVEVGKVIAILETEVGAAAEKPAETSVSVESPSAVEKKTEKIEISEPLQTLPKQAEDREGRHFFSPLVRKIAQENQVLPDELTQIRGSGKNGRVTKDDLLNYLQRRSAKTIGAAVRTKPVAVPPQPTAVPEYADERVEVMRMDHIRKAIADHMVRSVQTSPHVVTFAEVDMSRIVRLRERVKSGFEKKNGFKLTYTAFFVEAAAKALKEFPYLNASVENDKIILKKYYNIGVAVAVGQKLIVPVIKDADLKNLTGIARSMHELAEKARNKKLLPDDVQGGTFSVTNPGIFGNTVGVAIINQPQVAILDCGAVIKRPVVIDDAIAIRPIMWMSLSYDHRIIDGAMASMFTQKIVKLLENYDMGTPVL